MKFTFVRHHSWLAMPLVSTGLILSVASAGRLLAQDVSPPPAPGNLAPTNGSVEVPQAANDGDIDADLLTRGPIHEAYAEQYVADPEPGLVIGRKPPELIDELPPEEMPEGENVQWIPGYWAWDEDTDDFIWISGLWRDLPLGQQWIPGYWAEVEEGYQWVPGFWNSSETEELAYLPEPPESLEQGPNVSPPTENHFWVPGTWVYQTNNYLWRSGYWAQPYQDYIWIPARYQWTPRGYVFCSGYWDYPLVRRGVLFSPVRFVNRSFPYRYRGYRYRPRIVVASGPLLIHLFVRPRYRHYYFGDYYGSRYRDRGIYPFTQLNRYARRNYAYDPIRTYYQIGSRQTTYNRLVDWNRYFDRNESLRPPHTYAQTRQFLDRSVANINPVVARQTILSESIKELTREDRADRYRFRTISNNEREQFANRSASTVQQILDNRVQFERRNRSNTEPGENRPGLDKGERRPGPQRTQKEEISSLKLPQVNALQDRLSRHFQNQDRAEDPQQDRPEIGRRDQRPEASRFRENDARGERPELRRPGQLSENLTSPRPEERDPNQRDADRGSKRTTSPDDLRSRIEAARQGRSFDGVRRPDQPSQSNRREPTEQPETGESPTDRGRGRLQIDRGTRGQPEPKLQTERDTEGGLRGGNRPSDQSNQRSSEIRPGRESGAPAPGPSDLRKRVEESRTETDSSRMNRGTGIDRDGLRQGGANELRDRIDAARRIMERQGKEAGAVPRPERSTPESRGASDNRPSESGARSSAVDDLRSRIEAARRAQGTQRPSERQNSVPDRTSSDRRESGRTARPTAPQAKEMRSGPEQSFPRQIERGASSIPSRSNDAARSAPRSNSEPRSSRETRPATATRDRSESARPSRNRSGDAGKSSRSSKGKDK